MNYTTLDIANEIRRKIVDLEKQIVNADSKSVSAAYLNSSGHWYGIPVSENVKQIVQLICKADLEKQLSALHSELDNL